MYFSLVLLSWIDRIVMICSVQIDCKGFVDNRVEEIYLVGVTSCVSMSSWVASLDVSLWFVIGLTMRLPLP